jgi:hypothetical protein
MASSTELGQAQESYIYIYSSDRVITSPDITIVDMRVTKAKDTITASGLSKRAVRNEDVGVSYNAPEGAKVEASNIFTEHGSDSSQTLVGRFWLMCCRSSTVNL